MRTAKKSSKAKTKTKARAKKSKAVAKAKPRAAKARTTAQAKKRAVKSSAKAAPKTKARSKAKAKVKASAKSTARPTPTRARKPPPRRDATGRLDPKYASDLRARSRENQEDDNRAFFKKAHSGDDLAEELGEQAVGTMTSGEDQSEHLTGEEVEEERGGPFVKTREGDEFAGGTDRSNPRDSTREPFPRT